MGKPAQKLAKAIRDYLTFKNYFVWKGGCIATRNEQGGFYTVGDKGSPDLYAIGFEIVHDNDSCISTAIRMPVTYGIEIKAGKDVLSLVQQEWHEKARAHGMRIIIAHAVSDVIRVVESGSVSAGEGRAAAEARRGR